MARRRSCGSGQERMMRGRGRDEAARRGGSHGAEGTAGGGLSLWVSLVGVNGLVYVSNSLEAYGNVEVSPILLPAAKPLLLA